MRLNDDRQSSLKVGGGGLRGTFLLVGESF